MGRPMSTHKDHPEDLAAILKNADKWRHDRGIRLAPRIPTWTHVAIHHSATVDDWRCQTEAFRRSHTLGRGWQDIGYHFVCERIEGQPQVLAGRPLYLPGAHCRGMNHVAIGFCFAGNFSHEPPGAEMIDFAANFLAGLMGQIGISSDNIFGHVEHATTECPGLMFPLEELRSLVRARLAQ